MFKPISLLLIVGCGFASVASAAEGRAEARFSPIAVGCAAQPAVSWTAPKAAFLSAKGGTGGVSAASCCYSDPCPGWGGYMVSCCAEGCSAWSDRVWCSTTGFLYCPDPCASNGICNSSCVSDPDCCCCQSGAGCFDDSDCCGMTCVKQEFEILGSCSC